MVPLSKDGETREGGSEEVYDGRPHRSFLSRVDVLLLSLVVQEIENGNS